MYKGILYEGTGLVGLSELWETEPYTGAVLRSTPANPAHFGEGIIVVGDRIWQLTYQDGVAVEWDHQLLQPWREVPFEGEGWGTCFDDKGRVVISNGTEFLIFAAPIDVNITGAVTVSLDGGLPGRLNELECVGDRVWANVWPTDRIVRIDPASGLVDLVVNASGLLTPEQRTGVDVLNGIAHIGGDEFVLAGKLWPLSFRVRLPLA